MVAVTPTPTPQTPKPETPKPETQTGDNPLDLDGGYLTPPRATSTPTPTDDDMDGYARPVPHRHVYAEVGAAARPTGTRTPTTPRYNAPPVPNSEIPPALRLPKPFTHPKAKPSIALKPKTTYRGARPKIPPKPKLR